MYMYTHFPYYRHVLVGILAVHYVNQSRLLTKDSIPFYLLTALVSCVISWFKYMYVYSVSLLFYYNMYI